MASDIFDDVSEALSAEGVEDDKGFNESELQDIMSEIEDLEKEFENAESPVDDVAAEMLDDSDIVMDIVSDDPPVMSLQEKIDAEMAMGMEVLAETAEVPVAIVSAVPDVEKEIITNEFTSGQTADLVVDSLEVKPEADILSFEKTSVGPEISTVKTESTAKTGVSFEARGQMSLNLDFMVGQETAKLCIDPVKGLMVTLSGVELCINEESGCTVSMENGTKFTIPLSSQAISPKKKSA